MKIIYSACSHVGRARENNEDNLYADGITLTTDIREIPFSVDGSTYSPAIFAVCDGMGGEESGEVASQIAVQMLLNSSGVIKKSAPRQLNEDVQSYVNIAHKRISTDEENRGKRMGTTLALVAVTRSGVCCFNIGDSRIYCLQRNKLRQITNDHTLFAEQQKNTDVSHGIEIEEKDRHKLMRCIGIGKEFNIESYAPIFGKCRILICSDGLTDMVDKREIESAMNIYEQTYEAASYLLSLALKNGGRDNITLIVLDVKGQRLPFFNRLVR